jgi:hypothetical protein
MNILGPTNETIERMAARYIRDVLPPDGWSHRVWGSLSIEEYATECGVKLSTMKAAIRKRRRAR